MTERVERYRYWSSCDECGFQGLLEFAHRDGENYDDPESLVLVVIDEYQAMMRMARSARRE